MDESSADYFRRRERVERAAAKNSTCEVVRRIHQEMAERYAQLVEQGSGSSR